jgi:hypothetical protein
MINFGLTCDMHWLVDLKRIILSFANLILTCIQSVSEQDHYDSNYLELTNLSQRKHWRDKQQEVNYDICPIPLSLRVKDPPHILRADETPGLQSCSQNSKELTY